MWNRNLETFLGCDAAFQDADIALFGAPFDSTTSFRPGARFGPHAMRAESFGLESYSPYQDRDIADLRVFDGGDIELPFGNAGRALDLVEAACESILRAHKLPVMLGGEHLMTLGCLRAVHRRHPDLHVVHFDAHADLREDYLGEALSHATVMRHAWSLVGDRRVHQLGIRSGERAEFDFARDHIDQRPFSVRAAAEVAAAIGDAPVYVSVDLDVLDPSAFPGTGTPEAGGATFMELLQALMALEPLRIVAADVCELAPMLDPSGASTATACKVLRELLLILGGTTWARH